MRKFAKKNAKLVAAVTLAASMLTVPSVFALNESGDGDNSGNKPVSLVGYEFEAGTGSNDDTLVLHFDKQMDEATTEIVASMFRVQASGESAITFTADDMTIVTTATDNTASGTTAINKGTKVTLELDTDLNYTSGQRNTNPKDYVVTIDGRLMDNNGITLGNYMDGEDISFQIQVPGTSGYDANPHVTYVFGPTDSIVSGRYQDTSQESQVAAIFDRPFQNDSTKLSTFKSNFSTSWTTYPTVGAKSYPVESNNRDATDGNTVFFFSMTRPSSSSTIYNRDANTNYDLDLPAASYYYFGTGTQATAYDGGGASLDLHTVSSDYAGWEMNGDTVTAANANIGVSHDTDLHKLVVTWKETWVDPNPAEYEVWYIDSAVGDQYDGLGHWIYVGDVNGLGSGNEGDTITYEIVDDSSGANLHPVDDFSTYWVRVRPKNSSNIKAGFSKANASAQ